MKTTTRSRFIEHCRNLRGATMASVVYKTEPPIKKPKTSGMEGRIHKRSRIQVVLNFRFANSVNRQRERETPGDGVVTHFESLQRKWGQRIKGTPLVEHKGQFYLEVKVEKVLQTQYLLDEQVVPKEAIKEHLRDTKITAGRQNVGKPIVLRDIKLSAVEQVWMLGNVFVLE